MNQAYFGDKTKNPLVMECINIYVLALQKKDIYVEMLLGKMKNAVIFILR
jgi:hypothetical protein